jgi:hypothetical protein
LRKFLLPEISVFLKGYLGFPKSSPPEASGRARTKSPNIHVRITQTTPALPESKAAGVETGCKMILLRIDKNQRLRIVESLIFYELAGSLKAC